MEINANFPSKNLERINHLAHLTIDEDNIKEVLRV
jgi:hypothetical protein